MSRFSLSGTSCDEKKNFESGMAKKAGVGLALEQATPGTLCYVADIQPGGSADLNGGKY